MTFKNIFVKTIVLYPKEKKNPIQMRRKLDP